MVSTTDPSTTQSTQLPPAEAAATTAALADPSSYLVDLYAVLSAEYPTHNDDDDDDPALFAAFLHESKLSEPAARAFLSLPHIQSAITQRIRANARRTRLCSAPRRVNELFGEIDAATARGDTKAKFKAALAVLRILENRPPSKPRASRARRQSESPSIPPRVVTPSGQEQPQPQPQPQLDRFDRVRAHPAAPFHDHPLPPAPISNPPSAAVHAASPPPCPPSPSSAAHSPPQPLPICPPAPPFHPPQEPLALVPKPPIAPPPCAPFPQPSATPVTTAALATRVPPRELPTSGVCPAIPLATTPESPPPTSAHARAPLHAPALSLAPTRHNAVRSTRPSSAPRHPRRGAISATLPNRTAAASHNSAFRIPIRPP